MSVRNKVLSSLVAGAVFLGSFPTTIYAEEEVTAVDFLNGAITQAVSGIEDVNITTSVSDTVSKITTLSEAVFYDNDCIGYYKNNVLYQNSDFTTPLISKEGDSYIMDPSLMYTLLSDVNEGLVSTYTKTDIEDWSTIIGNWDLQLGGGPISDMSPAAIAPPVPYPVENQIDLPIIDHVPDITNLDDQAQMCNFSLKYDLYAGDLDGRTTASKTSPWLLFYIIDDEGNLYLQSEWMLLSSVGYLYTFSTSGLVLDGSSITMSSANTYATSSDVPNIWLQLYTDNESRLIGAVRFASSKLDKQSILAKPSTSGLWYNIKTCQPFTGETSSIEKAGCLFVNNYHYNNNVTSNSAVAESFSYFFQNQTATKTVTGNSELSANLARIMSLDASTPVTITTSDWFVEGTPIGEYLGSTVVLNSGEYADIATIADIDPLAFNVVVPLSLPVYVNNVGEVFVADNAVITNRSSAAVAIQDLSVSSSNVEGWKLVDNPSKERDAKEFSFTSTLQKNTILQPDENLSFTYDVQLSPCTEGAQSLDLSSLRVTLCWADELTP